MFSKVQMIGVFFILVANLAFSAEPEQMATPRGAGEGVYYGLPGWISIDSKAIGRGVLPSNGASRIALPTGFSIARAGDVFTTLSVGSDGRVVLGSVADDDPLPALGSGTRPHVIPTEKEILPVVGSSSIPLKWYHNNNYEGTYTIVQVGPFTVSGSSKNYSYQVLAYTDGEVQLLFWRHDGNGFLNNSVSTHFKDERSILGKSGFFNGSSLQWGDVSKVFFSSEASASAEYVLKNGVNLRNGWIAKSFNGHGVVFRKVPYGAGYATEMDFGTVEMAGALFAYDYSREHPVVGSFNDVVVRSEFSSGSPAISVWYFSESIMKTSEAKYPLISPKSVPGTISAGCPASKWVDGASDGTLLPCMFKDSWDALSANTNIEWRPAPAVKLQVMGNGKDRKLGLSSIMYHLRQPRSIQFRPPNLYELELRMGAGGFASVQGMKHATPYKVSSDRVIHAKIEAKPGQVVHRIVMNGYEVFKNGEFFFGRAAGDPQGLYVGMLDQTPKDRYESMELSMNLDRNILVEAEFSQCTGRVSTLLQPSYVKSEVFLDAPNTGAQRKIEKYTVQDGFGRVVQIQKKLGNGQFLVQGTYLDALGRTQFAPLSFVSSAQAYGYVDMACYQCIVQADAYYDGSDVVERTDDEGFPYVESVYHDADGSGASQSVAGLGAASLALSDLPVKSWSLPAFGTDDFMAEVDLTETGISSSYTVRLAKAMGMDGAEYLLNISRDSEGRYAQSIVDGAGSVLATRSFDGSHVLKTMQEFDAVGRPVTSYPAGRGMPRLAVTTEFDGVGRIVSVTGPDRGRVEKQYDTYGRERFIRDARQFTKGANYFTATEYDENGRIVRTGEVRGGHAFDAPEATIATSAFYPVTETVYGAVGAQKMGALGLTIDAGVVSDIVAQKNVQHDDVGAVVSYAENGSVSTLKAWSYDRLGRKEAQWVVYGIGSPPIKLEYLYNASGELAQSFFSEWDGSKWVDRSLREREYDSEGHLSKVLEDGRLVASYERTVRGKLSSKTLYDRGEAVVTRKAEKDIAGRPLTLEHLDGGTLLYKEDLGYGEAGSNQLAEATHTWHLDGAETSHHLAYTYDGLGRLTEASGDLGGGYAFDAAGRLTRKDELSVNLQMNYPMNSYKPISVFGLNDQGHSIQYHMYDATGNLVVDKYSGSTFRVGPRGLPVESRVYGSVDLPANLTVAQVESGSTFPNEKQRVEMGYDETGARAWRKVTDMATGSVRIEATVAGVGTYMQDDNGAWSLQRLELVEGGFRPDGNGAALFAVSDAQGNVRGYAQKNGGLVSAYGYTPYGQLQELKESNQADRARWQGKEWDGEYKFYYFGARFFDPMFGLWTSPDPAGQFANPYSYGGDPVNYVDPNGEFAFLIPAAIGAAVGAASGAYMCANSDASCARSILSGAAVGAAAGATGAWGGAALGGAVGSTGGYASSSWTQGNNLSAEGFGAAIATGAISGGVSGALGSSLGGGYLGAGVGGFAGSSFGAALNGAEGLDILTAGLQGAAMGLVSYGIADGWQSMQYYDVVATSKGKDSDADFFGERPKELWEVDLEFQIKVIRESELSQLTPDYRNGETLIEFRMQHRDGIFGWGAHTKIEKLWSESFLPPEATGTNGETVQVHRFAGTKGANLRAHTHPDGWVQVVSRIDQNHANWKYVNYVYGEGNKQLYEYSNNGYFHLTTGGY